MIQVACFFEVFELHPSYYLEPFQVLSNNFLLCLNSKLLNLSELIARIYFVFHLVFSINLLYLGQLDQYFMPKVLR
jgi:hypothetical protein